MDHAWGSGRWVALVALGACEPTNDESPDETGGDTDSEVVDDGPCPVTVFDSPDLQRPQFLLAGPDGAVWYSGITSDGAASLGRITGDGQVSHVLPPDLRSIGHLAVDGDGAIWFAGSQGEGPTTAGVIGRLVPGGDFTLFTDPGIHSPLGILPGPDGGVWFTDSWNGLIGRVGASGEFTLYPITAEEFATPRGLALGADGALYTPIASGLVRTNLQGEQTFIATPEVSNVYAVAAGNDGNVWFSATNPPAAIGRLTPEGDYTVYRDDRLRQPYALALGPTGELWFPAGSSEERYGAITPQGVFRFCVVRDSRNTPFHMIRGPDDKMWFTSGEVVYRIDHP